MSTPETTQAEVEASGLNLTAEEISSIETARRGVQEPENVNVVPESGPQRPDHIPEQFWKNGQVDTEGLAKSYAALRAKMDSGQQPQVEQTEQTEVEPTVDGKIAPKDEPAGDQTENVSPVTAAIESVAASFAENQAFTDEDYAALEAVGIPKAIADIYIEGLKASSAATLATLHSFTGGEDNYNKMISWAASNLTAEEIAAYNDALDNPALRENAVRGLNARFSSALPSEGNLVTINDTPSVSSDVFTSRDELIAAQKDPRYSTDAKYREEVAAKLARSQANGFQAFARPQFEREVLSR